MVQTGNADKFAAPLQRDGIYKIRAGPPLFHEPADDRLHVAPLLRRAWNHIGDDLFGEMSADRIDVFLCHCLLYTSRCV